MAAGEFSPACFAFATAAEVIFGAGTLKEIGASAARYGRRALVTSGARGQGVDRLAALLEERGVDTVPFAVEGEPSVDVVVEGAARARSEGCDLVIGMGGGSALDAGKAIAALATNPGDPLDYLEVVGRGSPLKSAPLPFIVIPTTAGTGSEVTRNAVLTVPWKRVKVSLRSPLLLARVAMVDPELTYSLPPEITAATGMDALAQVIEPFISRRANPLTDLFCREGIARAARSLPRAYLDGHDAAAREDMSFASLMGGLALANAGLGAVHGFAGVIGGMFDAPHGAVCAALLPGTMKVNIAALRARESGNSALARCKEIAALVTGDPNAQLEELPVWLDALRKDINIPGLAAYGLSVDDFPELVEKSSVASSMKANPLTLTNEEMEEILRLAL